MEKNVSKTNRLPIPLFAVLFFALLILLNSLSPGSRAARAHEKAFSSCVQDFRKGNYDSVMVSMFDISCYSPKDIKTFLGRDTYIFREIATQKNDLSYIKDLSDILSEQNTSAFPSRIYLGLDPDMLREIAGGDKRYALLIKNLFAKVLSSYPDMEYCIIFPYYRQEHYIDSGEYEGLAVNYKTLLDALAQYSNISYIFPTDQKWIYDNKLLFEEGSDIRIKQSLSADVLAHLIGNYHDVSADTAALRSETFAETLKEMAETPVSSPDLSGFNIVVFGDSIFGNYSNDTSIQNIIAGYSGADIICKAKGGMPAAEKTESGIGIWGGELDDLDTLKNEIAEIYSKDEKLLFIAEFGLNDYFEGYIIDDPEDLYSPYTLCGSLRLGIKTLKEAYPESTVILMSPGYITCFDADNSSYTGENPTFAEYKAAFPGLAKETGAYLYNLETDAGIEKDDFPDHLTDGIHYNENGRLMIAKSLIKFIDTNCR